MKIDLREIFRECEANDVIILVILLKRIEKLIEEHEKNEDGDFRELLQLVRGVMD